ncbi:MAG: sigma-70 family RNA polymerase sigma factor [Rhodothermales bacterium]
MTQRVEEQTDPMLGLVRRAQAGDVGAFEELYRKNVSRVYGLCLSMIGQQRRAEVLTQDVFVRVWQQFESFRGDCAFSTWLHRVAVNVVLMDLRTERRRTARVQSESDLEVFNTSSTYTAPEVAMDLREAIASLPPQARTVLVLHDVEGYTHAEIGNEMGIAPGTSKAHLHRARQLLRTMMEAHR